MPTDTATDRKGTPVRVGMPVKIVRLSPGFIEGLPEDEREDVASMVGMVLEVYEIDEHGAAWVERSWGNEDGSHRSHSIALDSDEMEVV